MAKVLVKVVTDSTADMSHEVCERLGIEVIPLRVLMGDEALRDGVDILPTNFYSRLPGMKKLPTTSQPAPGDFLNVYEKAVKEGYQVISLHISSVLSGTYANAVVAARNFPEGSVKVVDTQMVSAALAYYVLAAAELAKNGATMRQIEAELDSLKDRVKLVATVNTLEYLHKGGRIGGLQNLVGSLLSVKPILYLKDGKVQPLEQVRTRSKALQRMAEIAKGFGKIDRLSILHAEDKAAAGELANLLSGVFPMNEMNISYIGPVVGTHTGPGTIGIALVKAL